VLPAARRALGDGRVADPAAHQIRPECFARNVRRVDAPLEPVDHHRRDGDLRVFYRVEDDQVLVDAIGRKRGSQLFINGRKVTL